MWQHRVDERGEGAEESEEGRQHRVEERLVRVRARVRVGRKGVSIV